MVAIDIRGCLLNWPLMSLAPEFFTIKGWWRGKPYLADWFSYFHSCRVFPANRSVWQVHDLGHSPPKFSAYCLAESQSRSLFFGTAANGNSSNFSGPLARCFRFKLLSKGGLRQ